MSRALTSISHGIYDQLLELSAPSFKDFAAEGGYDLHLRPGLTKPMGRAEPWNKVVTLLELLDDYDEVLLFDADTLVTRYEPFPWVETRIGSTNHLLVVQDSPDGPVPNTGVWGVTKRTIPLLEKIWDYPISHNGEWVDTPWWEQSVYMAILGYDQSVRPVREPTGVALSDWGLKKLDPRWNVSKDDAAKYPDAIVRHASGVHCDFPMKLNLLRKWTGNDYDPTALTRPWRIVN